MSRKIAAFPGRFLLRGAVALIMAGTLAACGGGGGGGGGSVGVGVVASQPTVAPLTLTLTRVGPEAIELDWSDDSFVSTFLVVRDGSALASVTTNTLVDASVFVNQTYCYQVQGYDATGLLVASSSSGCITLLP